MERILSEEDRIRRAEIISQRRKNFIPASNINVSPKKKMSKLTKIFIQVLSSIIIFGVVYLINQNNSIAFEKIKPYVSNDIDFERAYSKINYIVNKLSNNLQNNQQIDNQEKNNIEEIQENTINETNKEIDNSVNINNTSEITTQNIVDTNTQGNDGVGGGSDGEELSQTDQDIAYIKANASFIKPIEGYITSGFGTRTPTDIVTENHSGVDIGANYGDDIIASMEGTVELISSEGDYGNHLKITNGAITTLYAHCSKILVSEGEHISQGQKIAQVGSTGRSTGPHLHFEIRKDNRAVDPQKILDL